MAGFFFWRCLRPGFPLQFLFTSAALQINKRFPLQSLTQTSSETASLRAKRSNPITFPHSCKDCRAALAMTVFLSTVFLLLDSCFFFFYFYHTNNE